MVTVIQYCIREVLQRKTFPKWLCLLKAEHCLVVMCVTLLCCCSISAKVAGDCDCSEKEVDPSKQNDLKAFDDL